MEREVFVVGFWLGLSTGMLGMCLLVILALASERTSRALRKALQAKKQHPRPLAISQRKDLRGFHRYDPEIHGTCALCGPEIPSFERWC